MKYEKVFKAYTFFLFFFFFLSLYKQSICKRQVTLKSLLHLGLYYIQGRLLHLGLLQLSPPTTEVNLDPKSFPQYFKFSQRANVLVFSPHTPLFPNFNSLSVQESQIYQSLLKPLKDLHPTTTSYGHARKVVGFR